VVTRRHHPFALTALAVAWTTSALADPDPQEVPPSTPSAAATAPTPEQAEPRPSATPKVHHAPVPVATAGQVLALEADIEHPQLVKRALLVYRSPKTEGFREVELLRASSGPYAAQVPAEELAWPSLGYTIELELLSGQRLAAFASRAAPHDVQVAEDLMDIRERALDQRLGGRRSVFNASGEWVSFGTSRAQSLSPAGTETVKDQYYRIEGGYTYRPLRVVTEFSIRLGVVRGQSPVPVRDPVPGQDPEDRFDVGLNYGAPTVRFRLHDQVHLETELLSSITEVGFSWGTGAALLLGDPYGSKLTLGFESIQTFGSRFFTRMDVTMSDRVTFGPIVEVTNMPSAEKYGVRLLGEVGVDVGGGLSAAVRGGYQARLSTSGGPAAGATLSYAF
jgi:hypothetical protein